MSAIGIAACLGGLFIMGCHGLTFRNRIDFSDAMLEPDDMRVTPDLARRRTDVVKGRAGFVPSIVESILLVASAHRAWAG